MTKTLLSFLTILCISVSVNSQTAWATKTTINASTGDAPYAMASGLIDGDLLPDIVIGTLLGNTLEWYKNNGDGTFSFQSSIVSTINGIGSLELVDVNGDNNIDVLATAYNNDLVVWLENDGAGNFSTENIISNTINGASGLALGDINNDNNIDFAVTAYEDDEVVWFSNDGSGNFTLEANKIDDTLNAPGIVNLSDIDGDGDLDALVATTAYNGTVDVIEIFRNNLIADGTVSFTKDPTSVTTGKLGIFSARFVDLDGDSNLDIIATEISYSGAPSTGNLYWYEDNGSGFTETAFNPTSSNPSLAQVKDLDNDGLNDIVLSHGALAGSIDLVWFKNNGSGNFGAEQTINNTLQQAYAYDIADYDDDGDMDITVCEFASDDLSYIENLLETLSVNDEVLSNIKIYPNPAKNILNFEGFATTSITIEITDLLGKRVLSTSHNTFEPLDVSALTNGVYAITINGSVTSKFIKE